MQVTFLHHSAFLVEVDDKVLIFDYFGGDRLKGYHFTGKIPEYVPDTPVYVFASHSHLDHYDPAILKLAEYYTNIHYILSNDIPVSPKYLKKQGVDPSVMNRITRVSPDHQYEVDGIRIMTLKSSETGVTALTNGVAFYVEVNGVTLFHAGDLADWYWEGIGELMNGRMTRNFRSEIRKLSGKPINVAFVPMDPRLGEHMYRSVEYLLDETDAEYVFPMHMWQNYEGIRACKKRISNHDKAERIMEISRENQNFLFGEE